MVDAEAVKDRVLNDESSDEKSIAERVRDRFNENKSSGQSFDERVSEQVAEQVNEKNEEADGVEKRTYISDPSEAPEGANVQEGDRGGYYYDNTDEAPTVGVPDGLEEHSEEYAERGPESRADMVFDLFEDEGMLDELEDEYEMGADVSAEDTVEPMLDHIGMEGEEREIMEDRLVEYLNES